LIGNLLEMVERTGVRCMEAELYRVCTAPGSLDSREI
jgi:hypothetical protein